MHPQHTALPSTVLRLPANPTAPSRELLMQTRCCPAPRMGPEELCVTQASSPRWGGGTGWALRSLPTQPCCDPTINSIASSRRAPPAMGPEAGQSCCPPPTADPPPETPPNPPSQHSRGRFGGSPVELILELPLSLGERGAGDALLAEVQLGVLLDVVPHDLLRGGRAVSRALRSPPGRGPEEEEREADRRPIHHPGALLLPHAALEEAGLSLGTWLNPTWLPGRLLGRAE